MSIQEQTARYMADTDVRRISGLERHGEIRKGTGIAIL